MHPNFTLGHWTTHGSMCQMIPTCTFHLTIKDFIMSSPLEKQKDSHDSKIWTMTLIICWLGASLGFAFFEFDKV